MRNVVNVMLTHDWEMLNTSNPEFKDTKQNFVILLKPNEKSLLNIPRQNPTVMPEKNPYCNGVDSLLT